MSFINHPGQLAPVTAISRRKPSIWERMLDTVTDQRQRASEQALSDLIARNGGSLTDEVERQIAQYL